MAEIKKSGKIPVSTVVHKEGFKINDNFVGKYISLTGYKDFYNPGIGLELSAPSSVTSGGETEEYQSESIRQVVTHSSSNNIKYVTVPIGLATLSEISGIPSTNRALALSDSRPAQLFKIPKDGQYRFVMTATGSYTVNAPQSQSTINSGIDIMLGTSGYNEMIATYVSPLNDDILTMPDLTCLLAGQKLIINENLESLAIESLKVGDNVYTAHQFTGELGLFAIEKVYSDTVSKWYEITTVNGEVIKSSGSHLLMVNGVAKQAQNLTLEDSLTIMNEGVMVDISIESITIHEESVEVFNVEVTDAHTYITENMIFHHNRKALPGEEPTDYTGGGEFNDYPEYNPDTGLYETPVRNSSGYFDNTVTFTKNLKLNDIIEIFGILNVSGTNTNINYSLDFTTFKLFIEYTGTATNNTGTFKNTLGIAEFNNKKIKLYGAERDTLVLKGNKLTS